MSRHSAKQRRMRGIGGRSKRQFLQLFTNVKRSAAYHGLSSYARSLLFELIDRYNGCNNGMIGLGVREAAYELGCCNGTVSNAMRDLDDAGLARLTIGDHRLHRVRNEDPSDGKAENCAGQAGDQDVKGAGVRLGCHSRSSDSSAQANLEHGRILERLLNSRCEICHATEGPFQACCFRASPSEATFS
jgi:hypothetical protein